MLTGIGGVFAAAGFICWLIILVDSFNNAVWKGLVSLCCCQLYTLYYAFFEFDHEHKWLIVLGWLLFEGFGGALMSAGGVKFHY